MKNYRLIVAAAFLVAVTALPAFAQGTRPAAPAQGGAPSAANVPDSKIALVNTDAFGDEKQGITRLVNAVKGVEREFQPRKTELQGLQTRIQTLTDQISKTTTVADPKTLQSQQDQLDLLKKDFQRRGEDAQAAYNKRMQEAISPIYDDIGKALDAFAKQRGITLLLDASKIGPAILSLNDGMDITAAFIREFNSKFPATAAAAGTR
ncbi:MAG TPA: OmpH family outer membrane protein [Pyrinomonadaceae bacterium]|jgi:outer membrane protein